MLRYKSNKQALIMAALIILLCLVCLTGSTLALFTNDPNKGTIGVITTSGRVDVDILDTAGESLKDKKLQFYTTSTNPNLYFEPGAVFYTQGFNVINKGNVPINFRLSLSDGAEIDMNAFDVWITTDPTDPTPPKNQKLPNEFFGKLMKENDITETYFLVIRMKESAGNDFQGKSYDGIGITVFAVQGNADITAFKE